MAKDPAGDEPKETDELRAEDVLEEPEGSSELPEGGYEDADVETSLTDVDVEFLDKAADELAAERLEDLQRVTAEYANYRKRTEANRDIERERVVGDVIRSLLPVLDDIEQRGGAEAVLHELGISDGELAVLREKAIAVE